MKILFASVCLSLACLCTAQRVGDLVVTPTRLGLDDKVRSASITVVNRGSQTVRYRLNVVDMDMSLDGVLSRTQNPTQNSASALLRLSPREVVLEPGAAQRIRILATFGDQKDGEFRSHLAFEPIKGPNDLFATSSSDEQGLRINLETRAVVTIPLILNHGKGVASTSVTDCSLTRNKATWIAQFTLHREGNRTVRGDVSVLFKPTSGGKPLLLGQILALPVYFPNDRRRVRLQLKGDLLSLGKGTIEFKFAETERAKGGASSAATIPAPD